MTGSDSLNAIARRLRPATHAGNEKGRRFRGNRGRGRGTMASVSLRESAMPLLDHFHPPLSRTHPWRSFHGAWVAAMARLLNAGVLPPGYYAVPFLDRDGPVEIDVATLQQFQPS